MMSKAHYGVALCQLKLKEFKAALNTIEGAIGLNKEDTRYYIYLKATCYKGLEEFDKAEECYYKVFDKHKEQELSIDCLLYKECYEPGEGWNVDKKNKAISILEGISFFKRFNSSELEQILKRMEIKVYPSNTLLLLPFSEVVVVLQGRILLHSYSITLEAP
jgi:tetratricopeptide (TPR) repeat protein